MRPALAPLVLGGLGIVLVAGLVHLSSVLMLPELGTQTAFDRIAAREPPARVIRLPPADAAGATPFRDPALSSAICRYDLGEGPLRVAVHAGDGGLTAISFHDRGGRSFYALTESSAVDGRLEVVLVTPAQLATIEASDGDDEPVREVRVTAPSSEGFVEFDVLARIGGADGAARLFGSMSCEVERRF